VLSTWQVLHRFTENGVFAADTNLVERALRPVATGRKSWLFSASERGGKAAAIAPSLIETCRPNGVEPFAHLKDVLGRISSQRVDRLAELLEQLRALLRIPDTAPELIDTYTDLSACRLEHFRDDPCAGKWGRTAPVDSPLRQVRSRRQHAHSRKLTVRQPSAKATRMRRA